MLLAAAMGSGKRSYLSTFSSLVYGMIPTVSVLMLVPGHIQAKVSTCFTSSFNNITSFFNLVCDAAVLDQKLINKLTDVCGLSCGDYCPRGSGLNQQIFGANTLGGNCEIFYNGTKVVGECVINVLSEALPSKGSETAIRVAVVASVGVSGLLVGYGLFRCQQRRAAQLQAALDAINTPDDESSLLLRV